MRMRLLCLFLFTSIVTLAQDADQKAIDSLLKILPLQKESIQKCRTLYSLADNLSQVNPEEGIKYADKALTLSQKLTFSEGIGLSYLYKAKCLTIMGEYEKSLGLFAKANTLFKNTGDNCLLGLSLLNTGVVFGRTGRFPDALDSFLNAVRNLEKCTDSKSYYTLANCYQNIGNVYNATENFQKALRYYDEAISRFGKIKGEEVMTAMNMASKGMVLSKLDKNAEALQSFLIAEKKLIALDEEVPLAYVRSWMGIAYLDLFQYDKSIAVSRSAFETISKIGDQDLMASTIQVIGQAYLRKGVESHDAGDLKIAFENLNKALQLHTEQDNHERLFQDYEYLSQYYEFNKDYKNSLAAHKKYAVFKDSVFNFKNKQSLQNLEDERTIERRDKEIQINRLTIETREKQRWFLIGGICLLLVIAGLVFYQSRIRKRNNVRLQQLNGELDQANKIKARFFSILNHDLRSPVANLIHFLHLQKESPEMLSEETKIRMENKTISSAENLLDSMEDILLWSKGQMENFKPHPKEIAVNLIFDDLRKHFSNVDKVKITYENPEDISIYTDENYVKTILRNLTGNAIKALEQTQNAMVVLKAWKQNGKNHISVADNGPGGTQGQFRALYDDNEVVGIKTGLGLHLIRDLAKAIDCDIAVESNSGNGTIFTLTFPK